MATPTTYTYSIQDDFPNHKVDSDRLSLEIRASSISVALDSISTDGDACSILFKDVLLGADESTLDTLVSVHSGEPLPDPHLDDGTPIVALNSRQDDDVPLIANAPRLGSSTVQPTHNFCDRCTWFGDSIRVKNQALTDSGDGLTWTSPDAYWIDMVSGRMHDDEAHSQDQKDENPEDPHGYLVEVKVDGEVKTMREPLEDSGGDYEVVWEDGKVVFFASQSGKTVIASYSKADKSTFRLKPSTGKILTIEDAETDFSEDLVWADGYEYTIYGYVDVFEPSSMRGNGDEIESVLSKSISSPPESPDEGDRYIIPSGSTGSWFGHDTEIAEFIVDSWVFELPNSEDWSIVLDEEKCYTFRSNTWNYTPYVSGELIQIKSDKYKRISQIINEGKGAHPKLTCVGSTSEEKELPLEQFRNVSRGMRSNWQSIPFWYGIATPLVYSYGMELHVRTLHDRSHDGEANFIVFYCSSNNE